MESVDAYLFVNVEIDFVLFYFNDEVYSSSHIKYINEIKIYLTVVEIVPNINYIF